MQIELCGDSSKKTTKLLYNQHSLFFLFFCFVSLNVINNEKSVWWWLKLFVFGCVSFLLLLVLVVVVALNENRFKGMFVDLYLIVLVGPNAIRSLLHCIYVLSKFGWLPSQLDTNVAMVRMAAVAVVVVSVMFSLDSHWEIAISLFFPLLSYKSSSHCVYITGLVNTNVKRKIFVNSKNWKVVRNVSVSLFLSLPFSFICVKYWNIHYV